MLSDGEDTSSLVTFDEVLDLAKRSETAIYAIGLRTAGGRARPRGSRKPSSSCAQLAQETGGRAFFPAKVEDLAAVYGADFRRAGEPVPGRLHLEERQARRRVAPRGRPRGPAGHRGADQAGLLRARAVARVSGTSSWSGMPGQGFPISSGRGTREHHPAGALPRRGTGLRRALRHAGSVAVGRAATTLLAAGALAHTFVIGMQTMAGGARADRGHDAGDLDLRLAARARVPLHGDDDRGTGDGRVHRAAARRAAGHPRHAPGASSSGCRSSRAPGSACTWRRCCSPTRASRWRA